jgi:hypothetical protein
MFDCQPQHEQLTLGASVMFFFTMLLCTVLVCMSLTQCRDIAASPL